MCLLQALPTGMPVSPAALIGQTPSHIVVSCSGCLMYVQGRARVGGSTWRTAGCPLDSLTVLQAISRGITKAGVGVETVNLEVESTDDAVKAVVESGGFVIGSPTLGGHMPTQVGSPILAGTAHCGVASVSQALGAHMSTYMGKLVRHWQC